MKTSINQLSQLTRLDRATIKRRLQAAGVAIPKGEKLDLATVLPVLVKGDPSTADELRAKRIAHTAAKTALLELDRKQREQELVEMGEAEAMIRSTLLPIRSLILSAPAVLAAKVNPSDPEHARAQIQSWVDNGLKTIREDIK
jgi:hypothetical protein